MIDDIASFARPIFILSGGEPLFRPDIFEIARHATEAGLIVALATNGTLIDQEVAMRIKDAGIRRVSVSFDGADATTHDTFRGVSVPLKVLWRGFNALRRRSMCPSRSIRQWHATMSTKCKRH